VSPAIVSVEFSYSNLIRGEINTDSAAAICSRAFPVLFRVDNKIAARIAAATSSARLTNETFRV
jgi:hypothetical protein